MDSLHFLTWNLNLLQRSHQAPFEWRIDETEAEVRKLVLDVDPDLVCFQELPEMVPYVETHELVPCNTMSHSGHCDNHST